MGAMRQRKKYQTPRYPWRKDLLDVDLKLIGTYGLRNKHELWRHHSALSKYREMARKILAKPPEQREKSEKELLGKLHNLNMISETATLDDVLDLSIENVLERRLQTQVLRLGLALSPQQARQLIVHGHISIGGRRVFSPSYIVSKTDENEIKFSSTSALSKSDHPIRKAITTSEKAKKETEEVQPIEAKGSEENE
jgi:small subunit ribosomal protein S4